MPHPNSCLIETSIVSLRTLPYHRKSCSHACITASASAPIHLSSTICHLESSTLCNDLSIPSIPSTFQGTVPTVHVNTKISSALSYKQELFEIHPEEAVCSSISRNREKVLYRRGRKDETRFTKRNYEIMRK